MTPFTVTPAAPGQWDAARALLADDLPAQLAPLDPPARWWVAHPVGRPAELLGAATLWPVPQRSPIWGFRALCGVPPARRRQGIGRALVSAVADEAAQWGAPHLISWSALPDGPASAFAQSLGAEVTHTLHHFLASSDTAMPRCALMVDRLRRLGHVPPGFALLPLHDVPRADVLALHCSEFNAAPDAARALFDTSLADPRIRALSVALWDGRQLAGYLLAGWNGQLPEVNFMASAPTWRTGWPVALLVQAFVARGVAAGSVQARFHCNVLARAPMKFARSIGAVLERVSRGWSLGVPSAAEATPAPSTTGLRRAGQVEPAVILSLPGLTLPQAQAQCSRGRLPHLAQLLDAWRVSDTPQAPWLEAWANGRTAQVVGWPAAQAPRQVSDLPPGSTWVAAEFDHAAQSTPAFWAMDPAAVQPRHAAALARAARMGATDVTEAQLAAVLGGWPADQQASLRLASAWLIARWSSRHNLGVHWAGMPDLDLLAVRFDGLPDWLAAAQLDAAGVDAATAAWLGFFDLMLGRYRQLIGPAVPLTLLVDKD